MKKIFISVLFLVLTLSGFTQKKPAPHLTKGKKVTGNFWIDRFGIVRTPQRDTIDGYAVQYYLNHSQVAKIAKDFYRGRFRPKDDDSTAVLLDLVTTSNNEIRPFYRWCLDATIEISDGALGEYPGEPALAYASKYPKEFFMYMDKSKARYNRWVNIISYSGLPTYEAGKEKVLKKEIIRKLKSNCIRCSARYKAKIDRFAADVVDKNALNNR